MAEQLNGTAPRILIVDDEPTTTKFASDILRANGYQVYLAISGEDALDTLRREIPDLVIIDLMLPGMSGLSLLRHIKKNPLWQDIPVMVLSALGEQEYIIQSFNDGAGDYLSKPFHPKDLVERVDRLIAGEIALNEDDILLQDETEIATRMISCMCSMYSGLINKSLKFIVTRLQDDHPIDAPDMQELLSKLIFAREMTSKLASLARENNFQVVDREKILPKVKDFMEMLYTEGID